MINHKKKNISQILIDSREQRMGRKALSFFNNQGISSKIVKLKDGDLMFVLENGEKVFIERKSFPDFVSSYIKGNHIQDQALRLSEHEYYACIVHGNFMDLKRVRALNRINQASVDKMTAVLMLFYKLPIFFVKDEIGYLKTSLIIAETVAKHHGKPLDSGFLDYGSGPSVAVKILAAQSNIGVQKAQLLLDHFGSPKAVLEASREELLSVNGVGDAMVANLRELKRFFDEGD